MKILGVVIAGGKSSRMGQDKALMELGDKPLIQHVVERLSSQVDAVVVNANGDAARFAFLGLPVIPDKLMTGTPLVGLHAALVYAASSGFEAVLTTPCDTPLLPADLSHRLQGETPAIALSSGQAHFLTGFWPVSLLPKLKAAIDGGMVRVMDWVLSCNARQIEWTGRDPFLNVNTPEDLARLSESP